MARSSYEKSQYYKFDPKHPVFSEGVVDNVQPNLLSDSESPYIRNARLDGYGVKKRPGRQVISNTTGTNKGGMIYFNRPTSSNNAIIARANIDSTHKLTTINDTTGVSTPIDTGSNITSDNYMNFTQGGDAIYCLNGVDGIGKWNGTTYSQKLITVPPPIANFSHLTFGNTIYGYGLAGTATITAFSSTIDVGITSAFVNGDTLQFVTDLGNIQSFNLYQVVSTGGSGSHNTITIAPYPNNTGTTIPSNAGVIGFVQTNAVFPSPSGTYISTVDSGGNGLAHGLSVGNPIRFVNNSASTDGTHQNIPPPLVINTTYYVNSIISADIFTVSATPGGSSILFTNLGSPTNTNSLVLVSSPSFSVIFNGSQWSGGDTIFSNSVLKSVGGVFDDFSSAGSDNFSLSEPVTGLSVTSETLFYFTRKTVVTTGIQDVTNNGGKTVYFQRPSQAYEGSVNHASIVSAGIVCYFLTPSNKIQQMVRGRSVVFGYEAHDLTHRKYRGIENFMNSLPKNQTQAVGYYHPEKQIIKWFLRDNNAPAGVNNICVIYDTNKDSFLIDTNIAFVAGCYSNDKAYTLGAYDGKVYRDEYGCNDEDAPINFFYQTKVFDSGEPSMRKEYWEERTFIQVNENTNLTQNLYVDDMVINTKTVVNPTNVITSAGGVGTTTMGTYAIGRDEGNENVQNISIIVTKGNLRKRGRNLYLTFEDNALNSHVLLQSMMIRLAVLPPQTFNFSD